MAGAVMVIGSAVINALAFSGSNYLFSKFDREAESKRHNQAMEQLSQAQSDYEKNRLAQLDFINEKIKQQRHAEKTYDSADEALHQYYIITGESLELPQLRQPVLSDFYTDSSLKMTEISELVLIVFGMVTVYYIAKQKDLNKNGQ